MKRSCVCFFMLTILFSLSLNAQVSYEWGNVEIGGGGFVSGVISDPNDENVFYVRTDVGGAYRWDESGQRWVSLMDWVSEQERGLLGIDGIAVDPQVTGRVYMLAGTSYWNDGKSAFLRSDDYGDTWDVIWVTDQFKAHGNGMGRGNGERLAVDPNNSEIIFTGTRFDGLFKSTDRGNTWQRVSSLDVTETANGNGIPIVLFDSNEVSNGVTQRIYAAVSRSGENLYVSDNGGESWSSLPPLPSPGSEANLMPQRMALTEDGASLYVTFGAGAGPHAQQWDGVNDYYSRGAVYKYDTEQESWTDISPENYLLDLDSLESVHYGAYSGVSIDPNNNDRIVVTSINSWRGPQFWDIDGEWVDAWGDNIYMSTDGGETWVDAFRYYWIDGGQEPPYNMIDANGYPWIEGNTVHWNGSITIDPFNPDRAFVTSGNGVFMSENLFDTTAEGEGRSRWKFAAAGIEETVPEEVISVPGGPLVSVIADYDGFVHNDITESPALGRHSLSEGGPVGSTRDLTNAAQEPGYMVKVADIGAEYSYGGLINTISYSSDTGKTWQAFSAHPGSNEIQYYSGYVAVSSDADVVLWSPVSDDAEGNAVGYQGIFRTLGGGYWTEAQGVDFHSHIVADPEVPDRFYTYNNESGIMYVSEDKGESFAPAGEPGTSSYQKFRAAPGREGHIWVPLTDTGLTLSENSGESFSLVEGVEYCEAVGFGKAAPDSDYPTVFIFGTVDGVTGIFRSTDKGETWNRVNDDEHEYGGLANGEFVVGDANVFGRVYMSTAGRGIVYGEPSDMSPVDHEAAQGEAGLKKGISISALHSERLLRVRFSDRKEGDVSLSIHSLNGKLVKGMKRSTVKGDNVINLNTEGLAQGVYVCRVKSADRAVQSRMVIMR